MDNRSNQSDLDIEKVIETYLLGWNITNAPERMDLMTRALAPNCVYFDSHLPEPTQGIHLHCQFIQRFRDKFSDLSLQLTSTPSSHHGYFRFQWKMIKGDGNVFIQGSFFGELDQENKIAKLVGFIDENK